MGYAKQYWPVIDRAVTKSINRMHRDAGLPDLPMSALAGISERDHLGCGAYGCAYLANTPHGRWVVKVTSDVREAKNTAAVIEYDPLRHHPGIVYFADIWQLGTQRIYAILKEELAVDSTLVDYPEYGDLSTLDFDSKEFNSAVRLFKDNARKNKGAVHPSVLKEVDDTEDILNEHRAHMLKNPLFSQLVDFHLLFQDTYGIALLDLHAGNVGFRHHDMSEEVIDLPYQHPEGKVADYFVALELGVSNIEDYQPDIPRIGNPRVI